ncbi:MAG: hypothetical protein ACJA0I_000807 [Gammaproteobacteria bacterium]|jgi:hypothetical protein
MITRKACAHLITSPLLFIFYASSFKQMVDVLDASFTLLVLVSLRVFQQSEANNHEDLVPKNLIARVGFNCREMTVRQSGFPVVHTQL